VLNRRNRPLNSHVLTTITMVTTAIITIMMAASLGHGQACQPRGPSNFTFVPQFLGDSMTVSVSLSPCETVTLTETHSLGTDGNRGTNVKMTYSNGSGQVLRSEQFWGFFSGGYSFPASSTMPTLGLAPSPPIGPWPL